MANPDQGSVVRPFKTMPLALVRGKGYARRGVPMEHRPLGSAAFSEVVADGVDAEPGDLVLDAVGRWCMVWNDAITFDARN